MFTRFKEMFEGRGIAQAELVPITHDARSTLKAWGFNPQEICGLQTIVSEFDGAYRNCLEKIKTIEAFLVEDDIGYSVTIPSKFDDKGLSSIANCRDIADVMIEQIRVSHILDIVNSKNPEGPVELRLAKGSNRTHFSKAVHVWVGLQKKSDSDSRGMIVLDGSYQEISHLKSNGYRVYGSDYPENVEKESSSVQLDLSDIIIQKDSIRVYSSHDRVIGISQDKSVSFSIGFTLHQGKIIPFIRVGHSNGTDAVIYLINPYSGEASHDFRDKAFTLTSAADAELKDMLNAINQIKFLPIEAVNS